MNSHNVHSRQFLCSQFPGDKTTSVPYTDRTMAIDSTLKIEPVPGSSPGVVILRLIGPLTLTTVSPLRALLRGTEPPARHTILDFGAVPFMDSAGMSEIINHEVYCRGKHVHLSLAGVTPRVLGMFHTTRLEQVLTLTSTVEEAEARA